MRQSKSGVSHRQDYQSLVNVDKQIFERVSAQVDKITSSEQHFNDIESRYRQLASTWLLATFGAMGFCLSNNFDLSFSKNLLIAGIAFAGMVGIVLLWVIDLLAYHQLLGSFFVEGLKLELEYSWLPPIRLNMMASQHGRGIMPRVVGFYSFPTGLLIALGFIALSFGLFDDRPAMELVMITLGLLLALLAVKWMHSRMHEVADQLYADVRPGIEKRLSHPLD